MEIPAGTRTAEILEALNEWSKTADYEEVQNMWNILTGLRGPDSNNQELKHETTSFIRSAVLHELADRADADVVYYNSDKELILKKLGEMSREENFSYSEGHFSRHIVHAANSILRSQGPNGYI